MGFKFSYLMCKQRKKSGKNHQNKRKATCGLVCLITFLFLACTPESQDGVEKSGGEKIESAVAVDAQDLIDEIVTAPGLGNENITYVAPLADAYSRIDPTRDGWESEAFSEAASKQLKNLAKDLTNPKKVKTGQFYNIFGSSPSLKVLPEDVKPFYSDDVFQINRGDLEQLKEFNDPKQAIKALMAPILQSEIIQTGVKLYKIEPRTEGVFTRVIFHATGESESGRMQINTEFDCLWEPNVKKPMLEKMTLSSYEEAIRKSKDGDPLFSDVTEAVFDGNDVYIKHLMRSTDHWRSRIPRIYGLDVVANHGIALGDVNGDGLDDLYLCQQGGLPNRLFIQKPDGALADFTEESETGWLDYCSSSLIIDVDNDGHRDLVIAQDFNLIFMRNNGEAKFEQILRIPAHAQTFSITAADYDEDGDLDIFACGYNPSGDRIRTGALGEPMPYHDAQNGGRNIFLENQGDWAFVEKTSEVGFDQNNNRFSFAATWVDFDNDNDLDLYVANDYGRNNLYRNIGGKFQDAAAELGVEDMSAGMSTNWADFNRDGALDLYVSNMFSAAGNRITFQRQFKPGTSTSLKAQYQRHARGNSLFQGSPDGGPFLDISESQGVAIGRWAWGSRFTDINGDGWEDIVVANGFISTEDTGDL